MEAYKQRMVNEYNELKERTDKLGFMLVKESQGGLDFELSCPVNLLKAQYNAMNSYLNILKLELGLQKISNCYLWKLN